MNFRHVVKTSACFVSVLAGLVAFQSSAAAQDGFCMYNGTTTGGAGGATVTVTNGTDFIAAAASSGPLIIQVQGVLSIGSAKVSANKTIIGLGTNATLYGKLDISDSVGASNVIVRYLRITGPIDDAIAIWNAPHVWIDRCTLYDSADGLCDMNHGTQPLYATVSWCKFHYVNQPQHRFTMIADGTYSSTTGVTNLGYFTLHHNWWSTNCDQRMAASSYGRVHYYNNYFSSTNNSYCSNARNGTEINSENNHYAGVKDAMTVSSGTTGKIRTSGNTYAGCTGATHPGTDTVFTPPYSYTLDPTATVVTNIIANAGAPGPDIVAIPPKIWDGGGSDGRWNTANNWAFNETPKQADSLLFAGNTRLLTTNNYASAFEFFGIGFSNNAGAFVLSGANFDLGRTITDDSTAVQTINNHIDFSFGQDRQDSNRYVNVSSPAGSLVLNGNIAGNSNAYFKNYGFTKQGPGLLTFNGTNTFIASFMLNGGLVQFKSLATNQPGSLGSGTNFNFNGGGLRWAPGNAADISVCNLNFQTNGATLDVGANSVTFANRIGNAGPGGLTKLGTGTLTFNATNNYTGSTLIAEGVLAFGANVSLTNSPQIIVSNGAVLDVSARTDGTLTLPAGRSLVGQGTVRGSVTAASGATVSPGFSIGTLTVTNALTFQAGSTNVMELNATTHTNDLITGMSMVNFGGRLVVTNLSGTPAPGDTFKLFQAVRCTNMFASIVLPPLTGGLLWTNKLAVDGTLAVVSPVNTTPTNLVHAVAGDRLQLTWPADHIGWRLEMQTNELTVGLNTNWFTFPASTVTNAVSVPLDAAGGSVFFRLNYP